MWFTTGILWWFLAMEAVNLSSFTVSAVDTLAENELLKPSQQEHHNLVALKTRQKRHRRTEKGAKKGAGKKTGGPKESDMKGKEDKKAQKKVEKKEKKKADKKEKKKADKKVAKKGKKDPGKKGTDFTGAKDERSAIDKEMGEDCADNSQCKTKACYFRDTQENEVGVCSCNTSTNAGCEESDECVGTYEDGYACHQKLREVGDDCFNDSECKTAACFFGLIPEGSPGICSCNTLTNAACEDGDNTTCAHHHGLVTQDAPPECVLPIGAACEDSEECLSYNCFEQTCQCSQIGESSCEESEVCDGNENDGYRCRPKQRDIGDECSEDSECKTDACFFGIASQDEPGVCSCNTTTNAGCQDKNNTKCEVSTILSDEAPQCFLPLGSFCDDPIECFSNRCFQQTCQCNAFFDVGCDQSQVCVGDNKVGSTCQLRLSKDGIQGSASNVSGGAQSSTLIPLLQMSLAVAIVCYSII